eukprot:6668620-Alexandrium_andersonii.AAC.1
MKEGRLPETPRNFSGISPKLPETLGTSPKLLEIRTVNLSISAPLRDSARKKLEERLSLIHISEPTRLALI